MSKLISALSDKQAFAVRLCISAIFGLLIAWLTQYDSRPMDTADTSIPTDRTIWRETLAISLALTAFVIWAGAGSMRRISLVIWSVIAFAFVGYITWFALNNGSGRGMNWGGQTFLLFPLLFIAHELVSSGDQAGKWVAPYETYFDEAWKRGVQLGLAILFTALFWGILALGGALLGFIGFDWLQRLLGNEFFSMPMTGMAFGVAVHLGDVQTKLLANVRNLILGVLSWLLPVITLIGGIFAGSLLASGLAPLWATKAATATLLAACVGFVLLINAAYQQGDKERSVPMVLQWCVRGAALLLLIFSVLAVWSLGLRIGQYGLTADRVFAGLGVLIALAYGVTYAASVFMPGRWMGRLEPINIGLAFLKCAFFIAILTPIATPNRLSVNDQVARLQSGKVSIANFDWWLLKDETGKYGKKALEKLALSTNADISAKAKAALDDKIGERPSRNRADNTIEAAPTRENIAAIDVVSPRGAKLPESFIQTNFTISTINFNVPSCLRVAPKKGEATSCKAAMMDLNNDKAAEVIIRDGPSLFVFTQIGGQWIGSTGFIDVGSAEDAFDAGNLRVAPVEWSDILVGERRARIEGFGKPQVTPVTPQTKTPQPPSK